MTLNSAILWCLLLAAAIEILTCLLRFGLCLEATRDTGFLSAVTRGLRIHHGYVGLVVIPLGLVWARGATIQWSVISGAALVVSDLAHHFLILWSVTGEPEFDLFYPPE